MKYSLIGDDEDRAFFYLNPDSGILTLRKSLATSSSSQFDFSVHVTDQRSDEKTAEASVSISITRDQLPPQFIAAPYTAEVSENQAVNTSVLKVTAQDPDPQGQLMFELRGVAPATDYFYIGSTNGLVYVKKPLNTETATSYTVSLVHHNDSDFCHCSGLHKVYHIFFSS